MSQILFLVSYCFHWLGLKYQVLETTRLKHAILYFMINHVLSFQSTIVFSEYVLSLFCFRMLYLVIFIFLDIPVTYAILFTGPRDPTCPGGLVSSFSNNSITLNLTKVTTDNRTQELCIHYVLPSKSGNALCVNKTSTGITIPGLESGIQYSFSIYASIPTQDGGIQSLDGCRTKTQYTCMY